MGVRHCLLTAGSWSQHRQPTEVGALSVVAHPDIGQCLSFLFFGLALLLVSQPVAMYHLTHSITSAVGSLLPGVSHLIPCFHSGKAPEWAGSHCRLKNTHQLFQPSGASGSYAQIFSYTIYTQELCRHVRSSQYTPHDVG